MDYCMKNETYVIPECRVFRIQFDADFMGSNVIPGYPGSDDPVIDEGDLD